MCPEVDLLSNYGQNFKKTVSFDDMMHLIAEERIVPHVDFDFGLIFYPGAPSKIKKITREQKNFSGTFEKPKCIPSNKLTQLFCWGGAYNF